MAYLLGDAGQDHSSQTCHTNLTNADFTTNDQTGRLKGIYVSADGVSGSLYQRWYKWQADQVVMQDSCLGGAATNPVMHETFGYDQMLRLTNMAMSCPSSDSRTRSFAYDSTSSGSTSNRGNRVSEGGSVPYAETYTGSTDSLLTRTSGTWTKGAYVWDGVGRVGERQAARFLPASPYYSPYQSTSLTYGTPGGASEVFSDATVGGLHYNYLYDAYGRRWQKNYPTAPVNDEFHYGLGNQMLMDRGVDNTGGVTSYPTDEYVWLGGRPIIMIRGKLNTSWQRQQDRNSGSCMRNSEARLCAVYFPTTDYLGKPVALVEADTRALAWAELENEPFTNGSNYRLASGETAHPYSRVQNGVTPLTGGTYNLPDVPTGYTGEFRVKYNLLDFAMCGIRPPGYSDYVTAYKAGVRDPISQVSGSFAGPKWSPWVSMPANGQFDVRLEVNTATFGVNCRDKTANYACHVTASWCTSNPTKAFTAVEGATVEAVEYRYRGTGTGFSASTPLRFPGHYYDDETGLMQNWNRYYDPQIGRYLQPEPVLKSARYVAWQSRRAGQMNPYAYAANNPVGFFDSNGLFFTNNTSYPANVKPEEYHRNEGAGTNEVPVAPGETYTGDIDGFTIPGVMPPGEFVKVTDNTDVTVGDHGLSSYAVCFSSTGLLGDYYHAANLAEQVIHEATNNSQNWDGKYVSKHQEDWGDLYYESLLDGYSGEAPPRSWKRW